MNVGRLVRGDMSKGFVSPVANAVLDLLEKHGESLLKEIGLMLFVNFDVCIVTPENGITN